MPGKGAAARSKSLPRQRPPSPRGNFGGPTHNHFEHAHFTPRAGTPRDETPRGESPRGGTPRAGTPRAPSPGVRRLDLSGTLGSPPSSREKCICSICNCGRHHCPAQTKSEIFYDGDAPHPFATTSSDYRKHDPKQYQLSRMRPSPRHVYSPSNERFEHTTTAQSSFVWHERPSSAARSSGMERSIKPGGSPTLLSSSLNSPDGRMDLTTSYGATFVEHPIPTKSARPPTEAYSYGSPRELRSTNQLDFAGKQPPRCPATILPARPASARSGHVKYHLDMGGTWS